MPGGTCGTGAPPSDGAGVQGLGDRYQCDALPLEALQQFAQRKGDFYRASESARRSNPSDRGAARFPALRGSDAVDRVSSARHYGHSAPQIVIARDSFSNIFPAVIISTTHPAILTADGSGQGQGVIYKTTAPRRLWPTRPIR